MVPPVARIITRGLTAAVATAGTARAATAMTNILRVRFMAASSVLHGGLGGAGDPGAGHLERVEDGVELLLGEHLVAQDQLAHRLAADVRLAGDAGGGLVADVRVDGGD